MTVDHAYLRRGTVIMIIAGVGGYLTDCALNLGVARLLLYLAIPAALGLILFAPWILTLFGPDYVVAARALSILTVGYLVSSVLALSAVWLQYSGNERRVMWVMLGVLMVNIVLNAVLIPVYGINGAAAGTMLMLAGSALILSVMMRRHIGVSPWPVGAVVRGLVSRKRR